MSVAFKTAMCVERYAANVQLYVLLVERVNKNEDRGNTDVGLFPGAQGVFLPQSTFGGGRGGSRCPLVQPPCASAAIRTLKIPETDSHINDWTHKYRSYWYSHPSVLCLQHTAQSPTCTGVLFSVSCIASVTEIHTTVNYMSRCIGQCV